MSDAHRDIMAGIINAAMDEWDASKPGTFAAHMAEHVADRVTAAGFGLVADAKREGVRESAAAALGSVDDIWGSVGRSIVRLSELREAAQRVLHGEWDNHLNWNLTDINRRQARARAAEMRQG